MHIIVSTIHSSVYYKIKDCSGTVRKNGYVSNGESIYYTISSGASECCYWTICFYWDEYTPPIALAGAGGKVTAQSYDCSKCYSFYVCPHETPCKVWINVEDKYCKGYEVYVDGVYQFTEGESGTPDGYCRFWVTPGTHKFELRKDGCSVSKSWYCQCGTVYHWVSMNDMYPRWCECNKPTPPPVKEVKFRGTVTGTSPEGLIGAINWYVSIDEWISGSLPCDEIDVTIAMCPPWGSYDNSISKGDKVEVYGKVDPWGEGKNCAVGLNGESYYIKKIEKPDLIIQDIWWSPSSPKEGDTVTINVKTKNKGSGDAGGFYVCYYVDGSYYDRDYVSSLSAGSTATTSFTWTAECGSHAIKAVADCYNAVAESDKTNNARTEDINVETPPKTIYVDDDFVDAPSNHKWNTVQKGINDANDGDRVIVYNGTYYENVVVNKSINLTGNDHPIVNGTKKLGNSIAIIADRCVINGFFITGSRTDWSDLHAGIKVESADNILKDNIVTGNMYGIDLAGSKNTVMNNEVYSNKYLGIELYATPSSFSSNNTITRNKISDNGIGIHLGGSSKNIVTGNNIFLNTEGIYLWGSGNLFYHNNFEDNYKNARDQPFGTNLWDNGAEGNYWSDYEEKYPDANKTDGVWDTPYEIPGGAGSKDNYPLVEPWPGSEWEEKIILPVPFYSQDSTYWCALASVSMLADYFRRANIFHPWDIAEALDKGKWEGLGIISPFHWVIFDETSKVVKNLEPAAEIKYWNKGTSNQGLQYILDNVKQDRPVILGLWSWEHAMVIVGYEIDSENPENPWIFIHDPDKMLKKIFPSDKAPFIAKRVKWSDIRDQMSGLNGADATYTAKMTIKDVYMPGGTINLEDGSVMLFDQLSEGKSYIYLLLDKGLKWNSSENHPLYLDHPKAMMLSFHVANQYDVEKNYQVLIMIDDKVLKSDQISVPPTNWKWCTPIVKISDISSGKHTLSIGVWETLQEYPYNIPCDLVEFPPFEVKTS